ncbi:MAG: OPT/YSL family transporter [Phycisphaerae bacterium]|nr:OPT/YSL family transporter [Phycisphaerae bacterium]
MALQHLTDDQVRDWSRAQKDRWWFENVFRGSMPQLTIRSAATGFLLGGVLSATNLYVGAKTGWTLGVGLTSVILAFAVFKLMSRVGFRDLTILENNCTQSIATAAGYMTSPLVGGMAAYMWASNKPLNWLHMLLFNIVLSILGVLVAFPMKRRFINDEQQPFPEGRACGVVLDTMYSSAAAVGLFKAKALAVSASLAGAVSFVSGESYMRLIQERWLGFSRSWHLPHTLDNWYYWLVAKGHVALPRIAGVDIRQLALRPELDLAMFGAGGLMGIKPATSLLIGMLLNFAVIVPWMIAEGEIKPARFDESGAPIFGRAHILNSWSLWWGITMMIVASMVALFAKPKVFVEVFRAIFARSAKPGTDADIVRHIELPLWVSWVGVPIVGGVGVWMAHEFFGVSWVLGALSIPLIIFLSLIAVSSTALTGITPGSSLSKIPQFIFGAADPARPATNLMTGVMCSEVALNASNLLMDIKPGYMLGAKPRQQAVGHCIGIIAGALASTPLFFVLFLDGYDPVAAAGDAKHVQNLMAPEGGQFTFPGALQWKGVSDLVVSIFGNTGTGSLLSASMVTSMIIAAVVSFIFEVLRIVTKNRFPISPLAIGLGVVVPPASSMAMFAGALFFHVTHTIYARRRESLGHRLWIDTHEPICAGIIAGAALIGIGDTIVKVFLL